jgi:hypothetical protein
VDAAVEFLAASFHEPQSKNRKDSAKDGLDTVAGADNELEQLNSGGTTGEHENPNTLNCANVQPALKTPGTDLQSRDAEAEEAVTKITEGSRSPSNLDTAEFAGSNSTPEIARHASPTVFGNENAKEKDADQSDDLNHYSPPKTSWQHGPSTDISEATTNGDEGSEARRQPHSSWRYGPSTDTPPANITGDEPDDANKQLLSDHLSQFVAEEQAAWSEDHGEIQHEALAESSFFDEAMGETLPTLPYHNPCM